MSKLIQLLDGANAGDRQAVADLFQLVYEDLKHLAARFIQQEKPGHTLQPTALVHEAYLRLIGSPQAESTAKPLPWTDRAHFFAAAAQAMRRILIESARRKKRDKRGGGIHREPLDPNQIAEPEMADDLLALDEALNALANVEPQIAALVNLRYFGGLTIKEVAAALGMAPRTADSYWAYARAWLLAEMNRGDDVHQ